MKITVLVNVYHTEKRNGDNYNQVILDGLALLGIFEISAKSAMFLPTISKKDKSVILKYAREHGYIPDCLKTENIHFKFSAKKEVDKFNPFYYIRYRNAPNYTLPRLHTSGWSLFYYTIKIHLAKNTQKFKSIFWENYFQRKHQKG